MNKVGKDNKGRDLYVFNDVEIAVEERTVSTTPPLTTTWKNMTLSHSAQAGWTIQAMR